MVSVYSGVKNIGRYSKRACLSEYKITEIDGEYISFKYKDYKDRDEKKKPKEKILRLHYRKFFPRLLQHVPAKYFRIVRYYGLYSNHGKIPKEYFDNEPETNEQPEKDLLYCETCKTDKILAYTYFDKRTRKERKKETSERMYELMKHKGKHAA